jgi:hypothetical protein
MTAPATAPATVRGICLGGPMNAESVAWTAERVPVVVDGAGVRSTSSPLVGRYELSSIRGGVRQYSWRSHWSVTR